MPPPTPTTADNPDTQKSKDLDRSLLHSLAWTGILSWASQAVTWTTTVVVARLLTPEDYGLVAMATVVLGLVAIVSEFGIQSTIVVMRELDESVVAQLNTVAIGLSAAAGVLFAASAHLMSAFFGAPALVPVVYALSLSFVISPLAIVPSGILQRELRFKLLALIQSVRAIVTGLVMIGLAWLGLGHWTLVLGNLMGMTISTLAILRHRACRFQMPIWREVRDALRFSSEIIVNRISWYVYSNSDFMVAGRRLGTDPLGAYSLTWSIASVPVEKVTALVTNVTPSYFSAVRKDIPELRRYFLGISQGLAWVTLPAAVGMAMVASDFVALFFGEQWELMIEPLRLLSLYAAFRSLVTLHPQILITLLDARFPMRISLLMTAVMPAAFFFGSRWGAAGIAWMWIAVYPLLTVPLYVRVFKRLESNLIQYLRTLWPALNSCLIMSAVVLMLGLVSREWSSLARFSVQVSAGAATYLLMIYFVYRDRFVSGLKLLRAR